MANYAHLVTQKDAVWIKIGLDTDAKTVAAPVFQIDSDNTYVEMSLTEQVVLVIYPVFCLIILLVNKQ